MRRLLVALLVALLAAGFAAARPPAALAGGDTSAVAINTKDGASIFRLAFAIKRVAGDVVDNQNAAVAYSKCERCRTTAISIQIVLVTGSPSVVTPTNVAVAVNEGCNLCSTFASAYQFVVGTGGPVRFTDEGLREIAAIKRELRALRKTDLTPFELQQRVKALMERLRRVLATQLVPAKPGDDEAGEDEEREDGDDAVDDDDAPTAGQTGEDEGGGTVTTEPATPTTTTEPAGTTTTEPTPTATEPPTTTTTEPTTTQTTTTEPTTTTTP